MSENAPQAFQPVLISRRGEWMAWGFFLVVSIEVLYLRLSLFVPVWAWVLWALLLFSSISISLGNWVDRRTFLRLEEDRICFENGLQRVKLGWSEVRQVSVLPARWGQLIRVASSRTGFSFKTLGEVSFQGKTIGQTGFAQGQAILDFILRKSGLRLVEESNNAYYYARG